MHGLLKGTVWVVLMALLAGGAEMALRAAILDRFEEIRVSRSLLDGGLTELGAEEPRCCKKVNNELHFCWDYNKQIQWGLENRNRNTEH